MKISLLLPALFYFIISSCNTTHQASNPINSKSSENDSLLTEERLKLRKYAFCKCLMEKYPADSFLLRDGSLQGYIETGSYGSHAYEVIDSFIQKKSSVSYKSKYSRSLYLMRCLDIYEDKELELLINNLDDETGVLQ
jgi:hypothetical protein